MFEYSRYDYFPNRARICQVKVSYRLKGTHPKGRRLKQKRFLVLSRIQNPNLLPKVLRLFCHGLVARRHFGELESYYRRIFAIKQCKPLRGGQSKKLIFFEFFEVTPGDQPLAKEPEDSGYEIARISLDNLASGTLGDQPLDKQPERSGYETHRREISNQKSCSKSSGRF